MNSLNNENIIKKEIVTKIDLLLKSTEDNSLNSFDNLTDLEKESNRFLYSNNHYLVLQYSKQNFILNIKKKYIYIIKLESEYIKFIIINSKNIIENVNLDKILVNKYLYLLDVLVDLRMNIDSNINLNNFIIFNKINLCTDINELDINKSCFLDINNAKIYTYYLEHKLNNIWQITQLLRLLTRNKLILSQFINNKPLLFISKLDSLFNTINILYFYSSISCYTKSIFFVNINSAVELIIIEILSILKRVLNYEFKNEQENENVNSNILSTILNKTFIINSVFYYLSSYNEVISKLAIIILNRLLKSSHKNLLISKIIIKDNYDPNTVTIKYFNKIYKFNYIDIIFSITEYLNKLYNELFDYYKLESFKFFTFLSCTLLEKSLYFRNYFDNLKAVKINSLYTNKPTNGIAFVTILVSNFTDTFKNEINITLSNFLNDYELNKHLLLFDQFDFPLIVVNIVDNVKFFFKLEDTLKCNNNFNVITNLIYFISYNYLFNNYEYLSDDSNLYNNKNLEKFNNITINKDDNINCMFKFIFTLNSKFFLIKNEFLNLVSIFLFNCCINDFVAKECFFNLSKCIFISVLNNNYSIIPENIKSSTEYEIYQELSCNNLLLNIKLMHLIYSYAPNRKYFTNLNIFDMHILSLFSNIRNYDINNNIYNSIINYLNAMAKNELISIIKCIDNTKKEYLKSYSDKIALNDSDKIVQNYLLKDIIGKGGFANVYKGLKITNNLEYEVNFNDNKILYFNEDFDMFYNTRYCALKEIKLEKHQLHLLNSVIKEKNYNTHFRNKSIVTKLIEDFVEEIKIWRNLKHKNIVKYIDTIYKSNSDINLNIYIVLEYVEGITLREFLDDLREKKLCLKSNEIFKITVEILSALYYLHNVKGLVYNDLNPNNILISFDYLSDSNTTKNNKNNNKPFVKLTDFGISKYINVKNKENKNNCNIYKSYDNNNNQNLNKSSLDCNNSFCNKINYKGTIFYSSPEIIKDEDITTKSDVWSLGCLLYELLSMKVAFNGDNSLNIAKKITDGSYNKLIKNEENKIVVEVIDKCLVVNPLERISIKDIISNYYIDYFVQNNIYLNNYNN